MNSPDDIDAARVDRIVRQDVDIFSTSRCPKCHGAVETNVVWGGRKHWYCYCCGYGNFHYVKDPEMNPHYRYR